MPGTARPEGFLATDGRAVDAKDLSPGGSVFEDIENALDAEEMDGMEDLAAIETVASSVVAAGLNEGVTVAAAAAGGPADAEDEDVDACTMSALTSLVAGVGLEAACSESSVPGFAVDVAEVVRATAATAAEEFNTADAVVAGEVVVVEIDVVEVVAIVVEAEVEDTTVLGAATASTSSKSSKPSP